MLSLVGIIALARQIIIQKVITLHMQEERLKASVKKKNSMGIVNTSMLSCKNIVPILVAIPKTNANTRDDKNITVCAPSFTA